MIVSNWKESHLVNADYEGAIGVHTERKHATNKHAYQSCYRQNVEVGLGGNQDILNKRSYGALF